ncbi:hypothetical protein TNCV_1669261 [Trichonephila clavipes]|nr:hypothetical protein TNCV_1669261 [Trichonephila clavipes]
MLSVTDRSWEKVFQRTLVKGRKSNILRDISFSPFPSKNHWHAQIFPSTSSVTVKLSSESQPPIPLTDTVPTTSNSLSMSAASSSSTACQHVLFFPTTSNSLSMSAASSSSTACPVLEAAVTASGAIPATSQDTKQRSKTRGRKRPPKNRFNNIKPEMEIEMAPCEPKKLAPVEYTTDKDMIIYDAENELESTPDYAEGDDNIPCKGKVIVKSNNAYYSFEYVCSYEDDN